MTISLHGAAVIVPRTLNINQRVVYSNSASVYRKKVSIEPGDTHQHDKVIFDGRTYIGKAIQNPELRKIGIRWLGDPTERGPSHTPTSDGAYIRRRR